MDIDFSFLTLLAQEGPKSPDLLSTMLPFFAVAVLLYMFMVVKPDQKDRARKDEMMKNLKKNDQIITRFGMYGTVASASPDSEEVVLKLEDNAKIRIRKAAIETIVNPTPPSSEKEEKSKK